MTTLSSLPPTSSRALVAAWVRSIRAHYAPPSRPVLTSAGVVSGATLMAFRFGIDPDTWRGWERGDAIPSAHNVERLMGIGTRMPMAADRGKILETIHEARAERESDRLC